MLERALRELAALLVIANHFATDTNMQVVVTVEAIYRELPIQHIVISRDLPLVMT
jgi:dihydroorotase